MQELDEEGEENAVSIPPDDAPATFHQVQEEFLEWWCRWKARFDILFNI